MTKTKSKPAASPRIGRKNVPPHSKRQKAEPPAERRPVACLECSHCCRYVGIEVNPPNTVRRATELLWYLYHENISLYEDGGEWMVQFETRCRNLGEDFKCGVYETRPHMCRDFSEKDCEINSDGAGRSMYTPEHFIEYLREHRPRMHAKLAKDGFLPPSAALEASRPRRLPMFVQRFDRLRALGAP